jgi:hypothetical protein
MFLALSALAQGPNAATAPAVALPNPDGLALSPQGFRVTGAASDTYRFGAAFAQWRPKESTEDRQVIQGRDFALAPAAMRWGRWSPGVELYYPLGFELRSNADLSPFLTWAQGTVDAGNPTAPTNWVMISTQIAQPPVLLIFDSPVQLQTSGRVGDWRIRPVGRFKGWVRVMAPLGPRRVGSTARDLGQAVKAIQPWIKHVRPDTPRLLKSEVRDDDGSVTQIWTFDRVGAIVPRAVSLARVGGYDLRLLTGAVPAMDLATGPVSFSTEPRIAVRFPMRRVPLGRPLVVGPTPTAGASTVSGFDAAGLLNLALENLASHREATVDESVSRAQEEFDLSLSPAATSSGPNPRPTPDPSLRDYTGVPAPLLAAHALLNQSQMLAEGTLETKNQPLSYLNRRFDPVRWVTVGSELPDQGMVDGTLAVANALAPEPELRARAAMLHAGRVAVATLPLFQQRRQFAVSDVPPDPLATLRRTLFTDPIEIPRPHPFVQALMSRVRIMSAVSVQATPHEGGYLLTWTHAADAPRVLILVSGYPVQVEARKNLARVTPRALLGVNALSFEPEAAGECQVWLRLPDWAEPLPAAAPPPIHLGGAPMPEGN